MLLAAASPLPEWEVLKRGVYREDGSLRDVYVLGTTRADWHRWIAFVNARYPVRWHADGRHEDVPGDAIEADFFAQYWEAGADRLATTVRVLVGPVQVNCHFFVETEIENDVDPREVRTPADHAGILAYLVDLSTALGKEVILTEENAEQEVWFRVNGKRVEFHPSPWL